MFDISLIDNVYFYLISMLVTTASVLIAVLSFIVVRRRGLELDQLEQKIPDAARYEDLQHRLLEAEDQWTEFQEQLGGARDLIAQQHEAKDWLEKNKVRLASVEAERQQQESLRAELEEVQRRLSERQQQMETLNREAAEAQFRMNTAKEMVEKLESSVEILEKQQSELKQSVAALEVEHNKLVTICTRDIQLAEKLKKNSNDFRNNEMNSTKK